MIPAEEIGMASALAAQAASAMANVQADISSSAFSARFSWTMRLTGIAWTVPISSTAWPRPDSVSASPAVLRALAAACLISPISASRTPRSGRLWSGWKGPATSSATRWCCAPTQVDQRMRGIMLIEIERHAAARVVLALGGFRKSRPSIPPIIDEIWWLNSARPR